jgi:hypothetical protein
MIECTFNREGGPAVIAWHRRQGMLWKSKPADAWEDRSGATVSSLQHPVRAALEQTWIKEFVVPYFCAMV